MKIIQKKLISLLGISRLMLPSCGKKSDKIEISIGRWPASQLTQEVNRFKQWKERFEADYPQYEIVPKTFEYSVASVQAKAQAHALPTIFQTWFTEPTRLVSRGYIKDITAQLTKLNWLDKMDSSRKETLTFDGKTYGVPRDGYGLGLLLNTRLLGEAGLLPEYKDQNGKTRYSIYNKDGTPAYPTTFEQIRQYSEEITSASDTKGILILSTNKNGGWQFSNRAWNFGATLQKKDANGKWVATLDDDKAVETLEWIQERKQNDYLVKETSVNYNDWSNSIGQKVARAFVGSDVIKLATTTGQVDKDDIAFVPMPKGPSGQQYSLFGGTPFVVSSDATDEQALGALRFLEYMGRSPEVSENSLKAREEGFQVSQSKGEPIIETIRPWVNSDYVAKTKEFDDKYVNVNKDNYKDFFNSIDTIRHAEVPYYAQERYTALDICISEVLTNPDTANCRTLLQNANTNFNNNYRSKVTD